MRNAVFKVILFLCTFIAATALQSNAAHALSTDDLILVNDPFNKQPRIQALQKEQQTEEKKAESEAQQTQPTPPAARVHTIARGESLSVIATQYSTTWKRIFDKNPHIANPDIISSGETITIPEPEEQLAERPLPEAAPVATAVVSPPAPGVVARNSSAGNTYIPGYCTWYAKNRRPDLPNRLGNASTWVSNAAAQGFATGSTPKAGAIGQQGNHVVYVEGVNADGSVTVSEMNYRGLFIISSRTVPATTFRYIY